MGIPRRANRPWAPHLSVDHKNLVARADLTYTKPVVRSEEGMPVGNGRMGSLVWTTPDALTPLSSPEPYLT